jgi:hypothetical protein
MKGDFATQEYNMLVKDMCDAVPEEYITSRPGQALIRYFMDRFTAYVKTQALFRR